MRSLDEAIAARSPESQSGIREMADEMILKTGLPMMRELQLSQKSVAEAMSCNSMLPRVLLQDAVSAQQPVKLKGCGT